MGLKRQQCPISGAAVQAVLMVDRMISPFTLMSGPILFLLSLVLVRNFQSWHDVITAICVYILWVLASRTLRVIPHFYRCPGAHLSKTAQAVALL